MAAGDSINQDLKVPVKTTREAAIMSTTTKSKTKQRLHNIILAMYIAPGNCTVRL